MQEVVPLLDTLGMSLRSGHSVAYIRRLCASGELPAIRVGKRQYRIDAQQFEEWLKSRTIAGNGEEKQ